ncbi:MAG: AAA family ATPase [Arachnia sp.]
MTEVSWDARVVSGLALVGALRDTVAVVTFRGSAGPPVTMPGIAQTGTATFQRDLCDDLALDLWAKGPLLRKDVSLSLIDTSTRLTISYLLSGCWVCGYDVSVDPVTGAVVEAITLSVARWDRVTPPAHLLAEKLAVERSAQVRRIDIGALTQKYMDQSPAVLDQILSEASRKGDVLLLDEADALFAKRSTVQDSHDRYSPTRQDELLNRLSAHRGPIVVVPESGGASHPDDLEPPT